MDKKKLKTERNIFQNIHKLGRIQPTFFKYFVRFRIKMHCLPPRSTGRISSRLQNTAPTPVADLHAFRPVCVSSTGNHTGITLHGRISTICFVTLHAIKDIRDSTLYERSPQSLGSWLSPSKENTLPRPRTVKCHGLSYFY